MRNRKMSFRTWRETELAWRAESAKIDLLSSALQDAVNGRVTWLEGFVAGHAFGLSRPSSARGGILIVKSYDYAKAFYADDWIAMTRATASPNPKRTMEYEQWVMLQTIASRVIRLQLEAREALRAPARVMLAGEVDQSVQNYRDHGGN